MQSSLVDIDGDSEMNRENELEESVISSPQDEDENHIDITSEIAKEIILHLRIRMGKESSPAKFFEIIKLLATIL